jgi:hypothetical protein
MGVTVPAAMIPASAWGISGRMWTHDEIASQDPFGGQGFRLRVPDGRIVTPAEVHEATGVSVCAVSVSSVWVDARAFEDDQTTEAVRQRWESYLALG